MELDYSESNKVYIGMKKYLDNLLSDTTLNISTDNFITLFSINLFNKNDQSPELSDDIKDNFSHTCF